MEAKLPKHNQPRVPTVGSLYLDHFGLDRDPFNLTPDPSLLYLSSSHQEALAQLVYGITARKGFLILTGEVGTGKTTLIHALLEQLKESHTKSAWVFRTIVSPRDLLQYICEDFGIIGLSACKELPHYLTLLNRFLLESYRAGANVALIIDEAQNLPEVALEGIRLLSNFETPRDKLLQIVLVGQPELAARLNSSELRQLRQRVVLRHHLRPLSLTECVEYITRRLALVGGDASIFAPEALETIYLYSEGTPRLINILCDNAMLSAYALCSKTVEPEMIREVAEDLQLEVIFRELVSSKAELSKKAVSAARIPTPEQTRSESIGVANEAQTETPPIQRGAVTPQLSEPAFAAPQNQHKELANEDAFPRSYLVDPELPRLFTKSKNLRRYWMSLIFILAVIIYLVAA